MRRRGFLSATLLSATGVRAAPAPVVLELFTSQGCSSCPPADAFLGELVRQPGVIGLAWHVDYWNSLGWTDKYARRAWTDRQKTYAAHLASEVFTPALVVNGATMLVGSDQASVRRAIDQTSRPPLAVTLYRTASGLQAEIGASSGALTGTLVTYDPEAATEVAAGENGGRRLIEYRVVREAVTLDGFDAANDATRCSTGSRRRSADPGRGMARDGCRGTDPSAESVIVRLADRGDRRIDQRRQRIPLGNNPVAAQQQHNPGHWRRIAVISVAVFPRIRHLV